MSLLNTYEVKRQIAQEVSSATDHVHIVSAFCKVNAMEFIDSHVKNTLQTKKLMVRFLLSDIMQGASDFGLYEYCKSHGWQMYVRFDLHAKTYIFDRKRCILGSANLTSRGLGLSLHGNYELSSLADVDESDLQKIDTLFDNAILMTDQIYEIMKSDYENAKQNTPNVSAASKWSDIVERCFNPKVGPLFTYDFPSEKVPKLDDISTLEFLQISRVPSKEELKQAFRWSKCFLWLYNYVNSCPDQTSYFGSVTAALHNALINDPKPYRKEVKDLLANLLSWIQILDIQDVCIDVPNHSQRIRIRDLSGVGSA